MSGEGFIALSTELFDEGYQYILSEHLLCQDTLEQYFSHQRHRTGSNNNPTMAEFLNNSLLLNTTKQVALAPKRGNTTSQSSAIKIDSTPVPKRKKKHNK